jgi:acyl carrier protein
VNRKQKIVDIVKAVSKKSSLPGDEESLFDSGYLDSFALPDMVAELEKQFHISIPDSDLNPRKFDTIARIYEYVESRS